MEEQLAQLNAAVFENGEGQRIFQVIGRQVKSLEEQHL